MAGEIYTNVIRLAANLIMTRLLYPEAFGLMLIINLFFLALAMLSNVGIRDSIIARQEEISDSYLHSAWTMMILRGAILMLLAMALARPIASHFGQEELLGLIMFVAIGSLIAGFASPQSILFEKRVRLQRVVVWETSTVTLSLILTVLGLLIYPSIWVLAANGIIAATIRTLSSYYVFPAKSLRLHWDRDAVGEMFRFGRWILIASALSFLARQGDSLIVSQWVTTERLGVFSIAIALARLLETVVGRINQSVLFPVYSELRAGSSDRVHAQLRRVKLAVFALCLPVIVLFSLFGRDIIGFLYDPRYLGAGWILEILAAGSIFYAAGASIRIIPLSFGDAYRHMWQQLVMVASLLLCMTAGGLLAGFPGLLAGMVAAQFVDYLVLRVVVMKYGVRDYWPDVLFIVATASTILLVWSIRGWPWLQLS